MLGTECATVGIGAMFMVMGYQSQRAVRHTLWPD